MTKLSRQTRIKAMAVAKGLSISGMVRDLTEQALTRQDLGQLIAKNQQDLDSRLKALDGRLSAIAAQAAPRTASDNKEIKDILYLVRMMGDALIKPDTVEGRRWHTASRARIFDEGR